MALEKNLQNKFRVYYLTAILSLVFAVVGFSYNAWRMEVSEDNNNIRTAAFEVLTELAELQQLIYAAHYDQDPVAGNPRIGWVKVGLILDLSLLIDARVQRRSLDLQNEWRENWPQLAADRAVADTLVERIDAIRRQITEVLSNLD